MMTLSKLREMFESNPFVDEILDMSDFRLGRIYCLFKCNDKYIADQLSGENKFEGYINRVKFFLPPGVLLEYDVEVAIKD